MTYEPRPGSTADRAIVYLRQNGPTFTGDLADAIDCDGESLPTNLTFALKHGALTRTLVNGVNRWALGDGVPLVAARRERPMSSAPSHEEAMAAARDSSPWQTANTPKGLTEVRPRDEVMASEACDSATGRVQNVELAVAVAPTTSPSVGSMGTGQAADADPRDGIGIDAAHGHAKPQVIRSKSTLFNSITQEFVTEEDLGHGQTRTTFSKDAPPEFDAVDLSFVKGGRSSATSSAAPKPEVEVEQHAELRFALWSDGSFEVRQDGMLLIAFARDQVREMVRYFDSISLDDVLAEQGA